ncbi:MAG: radical SAM family heme chaperone HemW [Mariniblastus sp.]|nr:radical SAM family heme chaperone HemW [Mariniblastus sp.]
MAVGTFNDARSLYLHVPFCRHRCGYCNFTLIAGRDDLVDRYLDALEQEIGRWPGTFELDTLFLGGGTPSYLNPNQLERLGQMIRRRFDLSAEIEFTAECNPNDLHPATVEALDQIGVNRLSLGIQSFDDQKLRFLERTHRATDAIGAIRLARQSFDNLSVDLIFACQGELPSDWERDLETALEQQPDHLSVYELTYEKGTQFWNRLNRGELEQVEEDRRAELYQGAIDRLTSAGLEHYEISSFCRSGYRCRHNQVYWRGEPFLAAGPGASRFVGGTRQTNHRSTTQYLKLIESGRSPVAESEEVDPLGLARDLIAFGLRLLDGFPLELFRRATGQELVDFLGARGEWLLAEGLIFIDGETCRLTERGLLVYDSIAEQIYRLQE